MKIGYFLSCEEYSPAELVQQARRRRAGRLRRAVDLRPLPSVERRAGREPVRLVGDRRDLPGLPAAGDHRGHLPDGAGAPGRGGPGGRHLEPAAGRPVRPRRGQRRGAERAHHRRQLAERRRPAGDAGGGRRGDAAAVELRRLRQPPRHPLHRRRRQALQPAGHPAAGLRLGLRAQGGASWPAGSATGSSAPCPTATLLQLFADSGGAGKPTQAGYKVCWGSDDDTCVDTAHRLWANSGVPGELSQVLPSPKHFEQASQLVTRQMTADSIAYGNDPDRHLQAFKPFAEAGFDEIYVSQMGGSEPGDVLCRLLRLLRRPAAPAARTRLSRRHPVRTPALTPHRPVSRHPAGG